MSDMLNLQTLMAVNISCFTVYVPHKINHKLHGSCLQPSECGAASGEQPHHHSSPVCGASHSAVWALLLCAKVLIKAGNAASMCQPKHKILMLWLN